MLVKLSDLAFTLGQANNIITHIIKHIGISISDTNDESFKLILIKISEDLEELESLIGYEFIEDLERKNEECQQLKD